jgi:hypothetical protein
VQLYCLRHFCVEKYTKLLWTGKTILPPAPQSADPATPTYGAAQRLCGYHRIYAETVWAAANKPPTSRPRHTAILWPMRRQSGAKRPLPPHTTGSTGQLPPRQRTHAPRRAQQHSPHELRTPPEGGASPHTNTIGETAADAAENQRATARKGRHEAYSRSQVARMSSLTCFRQPCLRDACRASPRDRSCASGFLSLQHANYRIAYTMPEPCRRGRHSGSPAD